MTLVEGAFGRIDVYKNGRYVGKGDRAIATAVQDDAAAHSLATRTSTSRWWGALTGAGVGFILLGGVGILLDGLQNFSSKWEAGLGGASIAVGIAQIILGVVQARHDQPDRSDPISAARMYNAHCTSDQRRE